MILKFKQFHCAMNSSLVLQKHYTYVFLINGGFFPSVSDNGLQGQTWVAIDAFIHLTVYTISEHDFNFTKITFMWYFHLITSIPFLHILPASTSESLSRAWFWLALRAM